MNQFWAGDLQSLEVSVGRLSSLLLPLLSSWNIYLRRDRYGPAYPISDVFGSLRLFIPSIIRQSTRFSSTTCYSLCSLLLSPFSPFYPRCKSSWESAAAPSSNNYGPLPTHVNIFYFSRSHFFGQETDDSRMSLPLQLSVPAANLPALSVFNSGGQFIRGEDIILLENRATQLNYSD